MLTKSSRVTRGSSLRVKPEKELGISSFTRFLFSLATLFIMLGALPVGVYLAGQKTSFLPEAQVTEPESTGETSFTIEQNKAMSSDDKLAVNILARSDKESANLFAARVIFPENFLEVSSIATSSATLPPDTKLESEVKTQFIANKWIQSSIENGQLTLIGGVANPGIKTSPDTKYILATVFFKIKNTGQVVLHLDPSSSIFKNADGDILTTRENDITFDVVATNPLPFPTPKSLKINKSQTSLTLLAPSGGELVAYNEPLLVKWSAANLDQITISLLLNDQILGNIASASASSGQTIIKPSDYILPTFLGPNNTFKIKISDPNGLSDVSRGPFAVTTDGFSQEASQAATLAIRGGDANQDGTIDLFDVSILLSKYGSATDSNFGVDLNGDQAVNDVDFYLLRNLMLQRGLIQ